MKVIKQIIPPEVMFLINKQRNERQRENDMMAHEDIPEGKYFTVGNRCFRALAVIVNGETITPGQNCEEVNIAEALNELNKEGE